MQLDGPMFREEGRGGSNGFWKTDYRDGGISEDSKVSVGATRTRVGLRTVFRGKGDVERVRAGKEGAPDLL